jgi:hypothetical protein
MKNTHITNGNPFAHKVKVDLHMLGALMLDRIGRHVDSADVVTIYQSCLAERSMKLSQQLTNPSGFSNSIGDSPILSLGTGTRDSELSFRGPRDQIVTQEHSISRSRATGVRTTSPISV